MQLFIIYFLVKYYYMAQQNTARVELISARFTKTDGYTLVLVDFLIFSFWLNQSLCIQWFYLLICCNIKKFLLKYHLYSKMLLFKSFHWVTSYNLQTNTDLQTHTLTTWRGQKMGIQKHFVFLFDNDIKSGWNRR